MELFNTETITGKEFKTIELVYGNAFYALPPNKALTLGIKAFQGGVIDGVTSMINVAKEVAETRIKIAAKDKNADAIVNVKINTSFDTGGVYVEYYGTAVKYI